MTGPVVCIAGRECQEIDADLARGLHNHIGARDDGIISEMIRIEAGNNFNKLEASFTRLY